MTEMATSERSSGTLKVAVPPLFHGRSTNDEGDAVTTGFTARRNQTAAATAILSRMDERLTSARYWLQGRRRHTDVRGGQAYCLVGSAHEAARALGLSRRDARRAIGELRRTAGLPSVWWFNDRPSTDVGDVRRLVKATLARLDAPATPAVDAELEQLVRDETARVRDEERTQPRV